MIDNLASTVELMTSGDYKDRFRAEYAQVKIRYDKLKSILDSYSDGSINFKPNCPAFMLKDQLDIMKEYIKILEDRALCERIDIFR